MQSAQHERTSPKRHRAEIGRIRVVIAELQGRNLDLKKDFKLGDVIRVSAQAKAAVMCTHEPARIQTFVAQTAVA